ncbi:MAG TPA: InlB B-repeat-containing protein [Syntrophomonadaceae bacterium]|nr:InlB B-repeat-containing protein [Syntrophomonadaceae bacterium]
MYKGIKRASKLGVILLLLCGMFVGVDYANAAGNWIECTSSGQVSSPIFLALDSHDNVYVADEYNHRIQKLNAATWEWSVIGKQGSGLGKFSAPFGVALDSHDNLYVSDIGSSRIQKLEASTQEWSLIGSPGQFSAPKGMAIDSSGNIYVADTGNNRIQKYTANGINKGWSVIGGYGTGLGQFNKPFGVALDSSGNIYFADTFNHRIQELSSGGHWSVVTSWSSSNYPDEIAVDGQNNIYVADSSSSIIRVYDASTRAETIVGGHGTGLGQFNCAFGVAVDSLGNMYVADSSNNRIQKQVNTMALTGIAITTPANKLTYSVGDNLNITGMVVTGTYSDGTKKPLTVTEANISGFNSSIPAASQLLTVTVEGKTAAYNIVINAPILTYTVTYDSNGASGSAPTDGNHYLQGASITVLGPGSLSNAGYSFAGWKHPSGLIYQENQSFAMEAADVTLTAQWTANPTVYWTVTFDGQGGSPDISKKQVRDGDPVIQPDDPTRSGYDFAGWFIDTNYDIPYHFDILIANDITLYARWTSTNPGGESFPIFSATPSFFEQFENYWF